MFRIWMLAASVAVALTVPVVASDIDAVATGEDFSVERVSVATDGTQGNGDSQFPSSISADGRFVAFAARSSNLVSGDTNDLQDIFVRDRSTGQTSRVSVASDGSQASSGFGNEWPSISADGRFVTFASGATNLIAEDTNGKGDIYVRDRSMTQTFRVSIASDGTQPNASSFTPAISAGGRYVAFVSGATNLVAGDTNGEEDIFVHDRSTGQTTRVNVSTSGAQANAETLREPHISADGRYVTFASLASNLVAGDTNGAYDSFVMDRSTGETTRVSVASNGTEGNGQSDRPSITDDGRLVAFESSASNLVTGDTNNWNDVFMRDRSTSRTTRVSVSSSGAQGNTGSSIPEISADGRFIAFDSSAGELVPGDSSGTVQDVFIRDVSTGETRRVSATPNGMQPNGGSARPSVSSEGRFAAFWSRASDLVASDTNGVEDIFVRDLEGSDLPPVRAPVVLIPGILGAWDAARFSRLKDCNAAAWAFANSKFWRYPDNERSDPVTGEEWYIADDYKRWYEDLANAGYEKGRDLFIFPYWALDPIGPVDGDSARSDTIVERLTTFVDGVLEISGAQKVNLVGHSEGGVVARGYATTVGSAKVNQLITFGAPHRGAPFGWPAWDGGELEHHFNRRFARALKAYIMCKEPSKVTNHELFHWIRSTQRASRTYCLRFPT